MFNLTFINILLVVLAAVINVSAADDLEAAWKKYQVEFPMKIQSKSEHGLRKSIFSETHNKIKEHNSKNDASFEMAHNAFSVMTEEEKQSYFGAIKPVPPSNVTRISSSLRQFPADIDFRENGCLPPVRRQGCGDCWAFSATSIVEFGKCKKNGRKGLDFSEQQLVDCTYGNDYNCANGGSEEAAWQYLASNGGQVHETSYPYTAKAGPCKACPSCGMTIGAKISSDNPVQWIASNDVNAMKSVLVEGRMIAIYIQVPSSFFNYKTGLFDDVQCVPSNAHGMAVIGYSRGYWKFNVPLWKFEWQNAEHWIVRNSWGPGWGEGGYIRIKIGVNLCGIESIPRTTNVF